MKAFRLFLIFFALGILAFPFQEARATAIEHYVARRVAEQSKTGISGWSAVTGTAGSGTTASTWGRFNHFGRGHGKGLCL